MESSYRDLEAGRVSLRGLGGVPRAGMASVVQLGSRERRARQQLLHPRLLHTHEVRRERGWCSRARGRDVGGRGMSNSLLSACPTYDD